MTPGVPRWQVWGGDPNPPTGIDWMTAFGPSEEEVRRFFFCVAGRASDGFRVGGTLIRDDSRCEGTSHVDTTSILEGRGRGLAEEEALAAVICIPWSLFAVELPGVG